jgi:hypothetical protein
MVLDESYEKVPMVPVASSAGMMFSVMSETLQQNNSEIELENISLACHILQGHYEVLISESMQRIHLKVKFPAKLISNNHKVEGLNKLGSPANSVIPSILVDAEFPPQLKVFAIDDSEMMCKGYSRLLLPQLKADLSQSEVCCPKTKEEVRKFIENALDPSKHANICILDQNIELKSRNGAVVGAMLFFYLSIQFFI